VGDSTVASYGAQDPLAGWGQFLPAVLGNGIEVINSADPGQSSRSFIVSGCWSKALENNCDVVLIQFGHNDIKKQNNQDRMTLPDSREETNHSFRFNVKAMIDDVRRQGAVPILVTPMERLRFEPDGLLIQLNGAHAQAMREVARFAAVQLIDLHAFSVNLYTLRGFAASAPMHAVIDGQFDSTHFSPAGAKVYAIEVANRLLELRPEIKAISNDVIPVTSALVEMESSALRQIEQLWQRQRPIIGRSILRRIEATVTVVAIVIIIAVVVNWALASG
jgi:pectinesterase